MEAHVPGAHVQMWALCQSPGWHSWLCHLPAVFPLAHSPVPKGWPGNEPRITFAIFYWLEQPQSLPRFKGKGLQLNHQMGECQCHVVKEPVGWEVSWRPHRQKYNTHTLCLGVGCPLWCPSCSPRGGHLVYASQSDYSIPLTTVWEWIYAPCRVISIFRGDDLWT